MLVELDEVIEWLSTNVYFYNMDEGVHSLDFKELSEDITAYFRMRGEK